MSTKEFFWMLVLAWAVFFLGLYTGSKYGFYGG